jgi:electron transfer flavoprotein beta subunit
VKIIVCIKHVPDTETKVKVAADGKSLDESGVKMVISPYDEYALEEALRLLEGDDAGELLAVSAGRDAVQTSLRQALAMGAHRAVHVKDDAYDVADAWSRGKALAAVAQAEEPALVFAGKYGVGADEGLTGPALAASLGWPHVAAVHRVELGDAGIKAWRSVEGAVEVIESSLPAVVTWDKGEHEPRYPSLKGIMAAKKKPLDVKTPSDLGLEGPGAPRLGVEALELPPPRAAGRILDGDPAQAAAELVRLLREEAKVI